MTWLGLAACLCLACPRTASPPGPLMGLDGQMHPVTVDATTRAWVYVFVGIECPISNRCLPELASLEKKYASQGIRFLHLYPNPDETPERIRRHRAEYGLGPDAYRDPAHTLARQLQTHRTPEVVVITRGGRQVYQGRVNDQYAALGVGKPAPTRHDLAEVLAAIVAGAPLEPRIQAAVGCSFRSYP
ncbi:MAG: hypothetical protein IT580_09170 [Verrucomicrobiales bacterium]|nr:hypothetical protein [Verrucomicrobiales bacterium]